jgi:hypothetical protein
VAPALQWLGRLSGRAEATTWADILIRQDASSGQSLLSLDGIALADLTGVGDSVRGAGANATSGQEQFSNVPVTALQYTPIPEPGSALLVVAALFLPVWAVVRRGPRE